MVTSPQVSWLFFKARAKRPYLSHTGRASNAEKQPTCPGPQGCDENGPAAALLVGHVSVQICSLLAPCRRPILIATKYLVFRGQDTRLSLLGQKPGRAHMAAGRNAKHPSDRFAPEKREDTLEIPEVGRCNFTALRKATRRVSQLYDVVLAPCGLRSTQWSILVHIGRAGKPTQTELADSLALDRSTLAHNLKPLERDGLVQVLDDEIDKRSRI